MPSSPRSWLAIGSSRSSTLCILLLVLGAGARIWGYLTSDALWMDELFLANNIRERGFLELLEPLDYGQNAPVGWLWIIKLATELGGTSEAALRLPGLLASLAALPLTFFVARRAVGAGAVIPVTLVACSPFVVWQALQVKQYSFDLLVALAITAATLHALDRQRLGPVAVLGLAGIYISMPAIFVCAAAGCVLLGNPLRRRDRAPNLRPGPVLVVGALWVAGFAVNYFLFLRPRSQDPWLYDYWASGLFPWPLDSISDLVWFPRVLASALGEPGGYLACGSAVVVLLLAGCVALVRPPAKDAPRPAQILLVLPILLTLGAAIAGMYPFTIRLVLFLVPALGVLVALGILWLGHRWPALRAWVWAASGVLTAVPFLLLLLWLPRGGLPLAADTRELFRQVDVIPTGETVLIEHIASHARRFYRGPRSRAVIEMPAAWSTDTRVAAMQRALRERREPSLWIALIRVADEAPPPLFWALGEDLRGGRLLLPRTYQWFVHGRTRWSPVAAFEAGLPPGWRVETSRASHGCRLWKVRRGP